MIPELRTMMYLDWFTLIIFILPWAIVIMRMRRTQSFRQADSLPKWKTLINYIKRDRVVVPIVGERAFPGQSFLQVPYLGLIEHMGKDAVLDWGDKKIVLAVENCYHTPEPEMLNAAQILYELGIHDTNNLKKLFLGEKMDYGTLELMGKVYMNMDKYDNNHGGSKLINEWKNYEGETKVFTPNKKLEHDKAIDKIDWVWKRRESN